MFLEKGWAAGLRLITPGRTFPVQDPAVLSLSKLQEFDGRPTHGLLGRRFFESYVLEIDPDNHLVRLHPAAGLPPATRTEGIRFELQEHRMIVPARVTPFARLPIDVRLAVDTGARSVVALHGPFSRQHDLYTTLERPVTSTVGGEVDGESRGTVGRLDTLEVGSHAYNRPLAVLLRDFLCFEPDTQHGNESRYDGTLGGGLLRRHRVIIDYGRRLLFLEPRASEYGTHSPSFEEDMSGLFLSEPLEESGALRVLSVIPGSPGGMAGLQRGDTIAEVNGQPSAQVGLLVLRDLFANEGRRVELLVHRSGWRNLVSLETRRVH
jgi:hypothetical protein